MRGLECLGKGTEANAAGLRVEAACASDMGYMHMASKQHVLRPGGSVVGGCGSGANSCPQIAAPGRLHPNAALG